MRIFDLVVEAGREEHIARHNVTVEEVEEVVYGRPFVRRERNGYYRSSGQTMGGRYLTVFLVPIAPGIGSLVTARDATPSERRTIRSPRGR